MLSKVGLLQPADATSVAGQWVNFELDPGKLSDYLRAIRQVSLWYSYTLCLPKSSPRSACVVWPHDDVCCNVGHRVLCVIRRALLLIRQRQSTSSICSIRKQFSKEKVTTLLRESKCALPPQSSAAMYSTHATYCAHTDKAKQHSDKYIGTAFKLSFEN
jgi:hypothetical protein